MLCRRSSARQSGWLLTSRSKVQVLSAAPKHLLLCSACGDLSPFYKQSQLERRTAIHKNNDSVLFSFLAFMNMSRFFPRNLKVYIIFSTYYYVRERVKVVIFEASEIADSCSILQYYHEAVRQHFKLTRIAMSALLSNTFYRNKLKKTLSLSLFSKRFPTYNNCLAFASHLAMVDKKREMRLFSVIF